MRGEVAPPNKNLKYTTDVILKYGDLKFSFGITVRCPASRMYEVCSKQLGVKVCRVIVSSYCNILR